MLFSYLQYLSVNLLKDHHYNAKIYQKCPLALSKLL